MWWLPNATWSIVSIHTRKDVKQDSGGQPQLYLFPRSHRQGRRESLRQATPSQHDSLRPSTPGEGEGRSSGSSHMRNQRIVQRHYQDPCMGLKHKSTSPCQSSGPYNTLDWAFHNIHGHNPPFGNFISGLWWREQEPTHGGRNFVPPRSPSTSRDAHKIAIQQERYNMVTDAARVPARNQDRGHQMKQNFEVPLVVTTSVQSLTKAQPPGVPD